MRYALLCHIRRSTCTAVPIIHVLCCVVFASPCVVQYVTAAAERRRRFKVTGVLLDHAELGLSPPTSPRRLLQQQRDQRQQVRRECSAGSWAGHGHGHGLNLTTDG